MDWTDMRCAEWTKTTDQTISKTISTVRMARYYSADDKHNQSTDKTYKTEQSTQNNSNYNNNNNNNHHQQQQQHAHQQQQQQQQQNISPV